MGKPTSFEVVFDGDNNTYTPGQWVKGTVHLDLAEEMPIKCVQVVLWGYASTNWWNYIYVGFHMAYRSSGYEEYFHEEILLGLDNKDGYKHPAGKSSYPFQYQLPETLPASFELNCENAKVRYYAEAVLVRSALKSNYKAKTMFSVIPTYDLNTVTHMELKYPHTVEKSKTICCGCCASAPIEGTLRVARRGYVPGETVMFDGEVENHSNRKIDRLMVELRQVAVGYCTKPWRMRRGFARELGKVQTGPIAAKGSGKISGSLVIPPVPTSTTPNGSSTINVQYELRLVADPSGASFDLHVPITLTVGNVPLQDQFDEINKRAQGTNIAGITLQEEAGGMAIPPALYQSDIFATNENKRKKNNKLFAPTVRTYCYSNEAFEDVDPKLTLAC